MSQQHKALLMRSKGARMELNLRNTPTPGPGEVLIRNIAVGLNPIDAYIQHAGMYNHHFVCAPYVLTLP